MIYLVNFRAGRCARGSVAALLLALGFGLSGAEGQVVPMDLPALTAGCEHAVVGTVLSVKPYWNPAHTRIQSDIALEIHEDLKGNIDAQVGTLTLTELGGTVGEITQAVTDTPEFHVGERVLVFTERTADGRLIVLGRDRAKFVLTPAPGIALDAAGNRVDDGAGSPAGRIGCPASGRDLVADATALLNARGFRQVQRAAPRARVVPAGVVHGGMVVNDEAGGGVRDDRGIGYGGTLAYSNTVITSLVQPHAGVQIADDIVLAGNVGCAISAYTLNVYAPDGIPFGVTAQLYDVDPSTGGVGLPISDTTATWSGLYPGTPRTLVATFSTPISVPGTLWMVVSFTTDNAGWLVADRAETGFTNDYFEVRNGGWARSYLTGNYAGFAAEVYCCGSPCSGVHDIDGAATTRWDFPLHRVNHDSRTTSIYLASELGCAGGSINALSYYVYSVPSAAMDNFWIRMRHTTLASYTSGAFENNDWTPVYFSASEPPGVALAWRKFTFSTPFIWNGHDNVEVDVGFNGNTTGTTSGRVYYFGGLTDPYRSKYLANNSTPCGGSTDPNTWTCPGTLTPNVPRAQFDFGSVPAISAVSPSSSAAGVGSAGPAGSLVTITGNYFGTKGVDDHVAFYSFTNGMDWYSYNDYYIVSWTNTQITCYVPAGASSKDVAVVKSGTWSNKYTFGVTWSNWYRWKDQSAMPLTYYVNTSAIPGVTGALGSTQASLQTWENVTGTYLDHSYVGTTTRNASNHSDGYNDIAWRSDWTTAGYGTGVIAQTTVSVSNGVIVEADMELNAQNFTWSSSGEAGKMDVQDIVTHEGGHGWVGLSDLYGTPDNAKTMYGLSNTGETTKRTLEPADIAGCQWLYANTYCPAWSQRFDEYVARVQVGSIDNSTSFTPGGYVSYTGLSTNMTIGTGYPITVTNGVAYPGDQCGIWVDWNQDGDFDEASETVGGISGGPGVFTATITPPAGATAGDTRMRIRILYDGLVSPCGEADFGEVEDYTVHMISAAPATPPNPTVQAQNCGNTVIQRTGAPPAGVTWYWQGTSCGTSTGLGSGETFTCTADGTYYLRARDNASGLWSPGCGSVAVTVVLQNALLVNLELIGMPAGTLSRCIEFELRDASCGVVSFERELTFHNGVATGEAFVVACGDYQCILARDPLHTLTRRLDRGASFTLSNNQYAASFTGANGLLGGDLYQDDAVDIVDFGVFVAEWGHTYDPNTTCATAWPHPDIDGNGVLDVGDFAFITTSFLITGDTRCCVPPDGRRAPRTSITLAELRQLGLERLAVADLNGDGVLDVTDVLAFQNGARPGPRPAPPPRPNAGRPAGAHD